MTLTPLKPGTSAYRAMIACLASADLPTSDLDEEANFFSYADGMAFGGIARHGDVALIRSLVVIEGARSRGTGSALLNALTDYARAAGVHELWLLTTTAQTYFSRQGFALAAREKAPEAIANSSQFRNLCPASAALMHKRLG